jgi:hypothetical protein
MAADDTVKNSKKVDKKTGAESGDDEESIVPKKHQVYTIGKGTGVLKIRTGSGDARVRTVSGVF